jgi:hypothetical protein
MGQFFLYSLFYLPLVRIFLCLRSQPCKSWVILRHFFDISLKFTRKEDTFKAS